MTAIAIVERYVDGDLHAPGAFPDGSQQRAALASWRRLRLRRSSSCIPLLPSLHVLLFAPAVHYAT